MAKRGNQGNGGGQPTKYKVSYNKEVYKLCLLNSTDKQIADFFNVDERTINNWKKEYPEFFQSIKDGKEKADSTIAESLYNRAKGYSHEDTHISNYKGEITTTNITKHYPPDTAAAFIWLKNRQGWSDQPKEITEQDLNINISASEITCIYLKNYHSCKIDKNITINRGGTGSSKTVSLAQIAMEFLLTGKIGEKTGKEFDIVSGTLPHLKTTALKALWEYANLYKIDNLFNHHKTDHTIKYKDRIINYFPGDDEKKMKSRRRDFLWISEADTISYDIYFQLQIRTNVHTFLDFNPDDEYIWINEELEQKRAITEKDVAVIQSSYLDNVFLNEKVIKEIEMLRSMDAEYWQIYGLGNYGSIAGLIYKNWQEYDVLPERKFIKVYGQDYGFSNSRDAMIEINWEIGTRNIYLKECYYELGLSTIELIEKTKEANPDNDPVFGDSAEARLMKEIRQSGVNLFKPKKSVLSAINLIRSFNLFIHSGSINLLKEIKRYKWDKKDGKRINKPLKIFDHLMDALAYGATGFMAMYGSKYKILKELTNTKDKKNMGEFIKQSIENP